jgi:hypothetical protein
MSTAIATELQEAFEQLRRRPDRPVEAQIGGLLVEMRVKPQRSAADIFREIGPWEGESTVDLMGRLEEERRRGGTKEPPRLG